MAHIGTLRDFRFKDKDVDDIRGSDLYGRNDEKLGEIDDVIFDHSTGEIQYAVVDTGGWLSSRKFLVPADRLHDRAGHDDDFAVDLTKDQIEDFPAYNEKSVDNENDWRDYETRYRAKWDETGGVLHKEGSVNIITPEPDEISAGPGSTSARDREVRDVTPTRLAGKFPDTAPGGDKIRMRPSGPAADAEDSKLPGAARESREPVGMGRDLRSEHDRSIRDERLRDQSRNDASMVDSSSRSFAGDVSGRVPDVPRRGRDADNINAGDLGYGDLNRTAVPSGNTRDLPPSYRDTVDGSLDTSNDMHRPYPVQEGRPARWRSFEERLRQHRHEATSTCNVCKLGNDRKVA